MDPKTFGSFFYELRKEHHMTQKEVAEHLFVSDKTISKWERGAGMPNISLLLPIAELFQISAAELLSAQKNSSSLQKNGQEKTKTEEHIKRKIRQHRRRWQIAYGICLLLCVAEISLLFINGYSWMELKDTVLVVCLLAFIFSGWFCFFAKELPCFYDEHSISYVSQGIFRMHLPGLSFNNSNWPYICMASKVCLLAAGLLVPLFTYICLLLNGTFFWQYIGTWSIILLFLCYAGLLYFIGYKYK